MKASHFATLAFVLLLLLSAHPGIAADKCDPVLDTWQNDCTDHDAVKNAANICPLTGIFSKACVLDVSEVAETAKVNQQKTGRSADIICVSVKTTIKWNEKMDKSKFYVDFGANSPFPTALFVGSTGHSDSGIISDNAAGCYSYSVKHCVSGNACATYDPKVIVQGMGFLKHAK